MYCGRRLLWTKYQPCFHKNWRKMPNTKVTFLSSVAKLFHSFANDFVNSWWPTVGSFWSSCITVRCCWQYMKNAFAGFFGALGSLSLSFSFELSRFLVFFITGKSGDMNSPGKSSGSTGFGNASEAISERSSAYNEIRGTIIIIIDYKFLLDLMQISNFLHMRFR